MTFYEVNFTTKQFEPRSKAVARLSFYLCIGTLKTNDMNDIFERDLNGEMVSPNDQGYDELITDIFDTMKTATEMNTGYKTPAEVHEYMGRILGKPLDESTTVLPPLYVDYGKPVTIGKGCFIQQCCLWAWRNHNRQRCIYRPEMQLDYHQPRPEPRQPFGHLRTSDRHRGQGVDRHQLDDTARRSAGLRLYRRCRQRRDEGRAAHDRRGRQSGTDNQKNRSDIT